MFKDGKARRSFIVVVFTYTLDLVGFSLAFPVLAPLLLNPKLHYFAADVSITMRTTHLGLLFAAFGMAQFVATPILGAVADYVGRRKIFLFTIAASVLGYLVMAWGVWEESLVLLYVGRIWTGCCSGNFGLAQAAVADLTTHEHRPKAFGYLVGTGSLGFVAGPWLGGILANPTHLHGAVPFLFTAAVALVNFIGIWLYFLETFERQEARGTFLSGFRDISLAFRLPQVRWLLIAFFLYLAGWGFWMLFYPTYLVQRFALPANVIGDLYAWCGLFWAFFAIFVNKEQIKFVPIRKVTIIALVVAAVSIGGLLLAPKVWWMLPILVFAVWGGSTAWTDLSTLVSIEAPHDYQGRILGVCTSLWSLAQVIAALVSGPLAGVNLYLPLSIGAGLCLVSGACMLRRPAHVPA